MSTNAIQPGSESIEAAPCLICQIATLVIFAWRLLFFNYGKYVGWVSKIVASSNFCEEGKGRNLKRLEENKEEKRGKKKKVAKRNINAFEF